MHLFFGVLITTNALDETPPRRQTGQERGVPEDFDGAIGWQAIPVKIVGTHKVRKCPERVSQTIELICNEEITEFDRKEIA